MIAEEKQLQKAATPCLNKWVQSRGNGYVIPATSTDPWNFIGWFDHEQLFALEAITDSVTVYPSMESSFIGNGTTEQRSVWLHHH